VNDFIGSLLVNSFLAIVIPWLGKPGTSNCVVASVNTNHRDNFGTNLDRARKAKMQVESSLPLTLAEQLEPEGTGFAPDRFSNSFSGRILHDKAFAANDLVSVAMFPSFPVVPRRGRPQEGQNRNNFWFTLLAALALGPFWLLGVAAKGTRQRQRPRTRAEIEIERRAKLDRTVQDSRRFASAISSTNRPTSRAGI
jgi:hypothetical protein